MILYLIILFVALIFSYFLDSIVSTFFQMRLANRLVGSRLKTKKAHLELFIFSLVYIFCLLYIAYCTILSLKGFLNSYYAFGPILLLVVMPLKSTKWQIKRFFVYTNIISKYNYKKFYAVARRFTPSTNLLNTLISIQPIGQNSFHYTYSKDKTITVEFFGRQITIRSGNDVFHVSSLHELKTIATKVQLGF